MNKINVSLDNIYNDLLAYRTMLNDGDICCSNYKDYKRIFDLILLVPKILKDYNDEINSFGVSCLDENLMNTLKILIDGEYYVEN